MKMDATQPRSDLLAHAVSIDLEVDPTTARIFAFAAVVRDPAVPNLVAEGTVTDALKKLDGVCQGFEHVIGHNILKHGAH